VPWIASYEEDTCRTSLDGFVGGVRCFGAYVIEIAPVGAAGRLPSTILIAAGGEITIYTPPAVGGRKTIAPTRRAMPSDAVIAFRMIDLL
jgi:hypothetical protein